MVRLKVREIAESKGINMSKLSRIADVSYNTTQALFHNPQHDVSIYILERIAKALNVKICDLIEETSDN
ncbi:MAG: helix-turn-helix domain-containing protein [Ktedonobacteraceae bacterium]|jgi:DNA-binding Xre family transcriptional regulator